MKNKSIQHLAFSIQHSKFSEAKLEHAQAGQSKADFIAKMSIARKESRETLYWLKLLKASNLVDENMIGEILKESDELVRILTSIVKSAQKGKSDEK